MYLGIDLGTSALKALLVDDGLGVVAEASAPLAVGRPRPLWSEQDPEDWWRALETAIGRLRATRRREFGAVRAIGLTGQMHGAVLLGGAHEVLRPCILWNDGRSATECAELERREPATRQITGNLVMPGFTAPKILWVAAHEPEVFAATKMVLLPKDYLRLRLTGVAATDASDASGTCWLDVGARAWSERMLDASGLGMRSMPELFEGNAATGVLLPSVAASWGLGRSTIVAAGAGDNAAAAIGVGAIDPGMGLVSIGTSGVIFEVDADFKPAPDRAVHTFCHCLPGRWHRMGVILSAASCLSWLREITGAPDETTLAQEAERAADSPELMFLPHLAGERTPYNNPLATGAFVGLTHRAGRGDLARAVLEGVALAFADAFAGMQPGAAGGKPLYAVGGGAHSAFWLAMMASALDRTLVTAADSVGGPAFGAARLARLAETGADPAEICGQPAPTRRFEPERRDVTRLAARLQRFRRLYAALNAGCDDNAASTGRSASDPRPTTA